MRFFKETIKYMWKNLPSLIPYALIPAIAMALSGNLGSIVTFFFHYGENVDTVWDVYRAFSIVMSKNWLTGASAVVLVGFFLCFLFGAIDRHMKVGKMHLFKNMFSHLNETVLAVVPAYFAVFALLELVGILTAALVFMFLNSFGFNSIFIAIPVTLAMYCCAFLALTQFVILIPSEIIVGYPFKDAVINSVRLVSGNMWEIWLQLMLSCLVPVLISAIINLIFPSAPALSFFVDVFLNLALLIFTTCYAMVAYFILSNEPRRDVEEKKKYLT